MAFFDVDDAADLASKIRAFQNGRLNFNPYRPPPPPPPFGADWGQLLRSLTDWL